MLTCAIVASSIVIFGPKDVIILPKDELVHIELEVGQVIVNGVIMQNVDSSVVVDVVSKCESKD